MVSIFLNANLLSHLNIASGIALLAIAGVLLFNAPRDKVNQAFILLIFFSAIWIFSYGLGQIPRDENATSTIFALAYLGVPFIGPAVFLLSEIWTKESPSKKPIYLGFILGAMLAAIYVSKPHLFFQVKSYDWGRYDVIEKTWPSLTHHFLLISTFAAFSLMALKNFYSGYKSSKSTRERKQLKTVFIAFLFCYMGAADFLTSWGFDLFPIGCIALTAFSVIITHTIFQHQAFHIDFFTNRISLIALIYTFLLAIALPLTHLLSPDEIKALPRLLLPLVILGCLLSTGPLIYSFLTHRSHWIRSTFATGLAHELKTPLAVIQCNADLIDSLGKSERISEYTGAIISNSNRLLNLAQNLLAASRIDGVGNTIDKQDFDLAQVIKEEIERHRPLIKRETKRLDVSISEKLPFFGDEGKIRQAISNLISNSIRYSPEGATIKANGEMNGGTILLRLTNPTEASAKKSLFSSGLGLDIAKAWLEAHGAEMTCARKNGFNEVQVILPAGTQ